MVAQQYCFFVGLQESLQELSEVNVEPGAQLVCTVEGKQTPLLCALFWQQNMGGFDDEEESIVVSHSLLHVPSDTGEPMQSVAFTAVS